MYQLYSQTTALRTICCDAGLFIQSVSYPLKLFSPLTCCQLSPCCISIIIWHSPSLFLPISCPLATEDSPFQNFQTDTFLRERRSKAHSKTAITQDRNLGSYLVLVTVWIYGSLLQFVITSCALKHCPNMFCCESTDPVWHYFKRERAMRHHY